MGAIFRQSENPVASLFSFVTLLISKNNLNLKPLDFHSWRKESLTGLEHFLPQPLGPPPTVKWFNHNTSLTNLVGAAAFVKNSYQKVAGHLLAPQQKLFYVRISKAASTSMGSEMLNLIKPDLKNESLTPVQINFLVDAWLQTSIDEDLKTFKGFTVVRNPFERLISVYRDFFEQGTDKPFIYQNYLGGILHRTLSFDEFIERISRIPDRFKDQHFKPQHLFIYPYTKAGLNAQVFKLEEPLLLQNFLSSYGIKLLHLNQGMIKPEFTCTASTANRIRKMYAFDFEVYGYDQNLPF